MKQRPIIKLELTTTDKAIELLGWISIMAIWLLTIISYTNLPDIIPTHYNAEGDPDGFGGKRLILIEPFIATVIFFGMTILNKFPHTYNYLTEITTENALKHYRCNKVDWIFKAKCCYRFWTYFTSNHQKC